jgi:hypothetical protein
VELRLTVRPNNSAKKFHARSTVASSHNSHNRSAASFAAAQSKPRCTRHSRTSPAVGNRIQIGASLPGKLWQKHNSAPATSYPLNGPCLDGRAGQGYANEIARSVGILFTLRSGDNWLRFWSERVPRAAAFSEARSRQALLSVLVLFIVLGPIKLRRIGETKRRDSALCFHSPLPSGEF